MDKPSKLEAALHQMTRDVMARDFGTQHGAQEAFRCALGVPRSSFSLFLRGGRPGTNPGRVEGKGRQSLVQRLHAYVKAKAAAAKNTKDYQFYFDATMVIWAFTLNDPDFLPENK